MRVMLVIRPAAWLGISFLFLFMVGCKTLDSVVGSMSKPSAEIAGVHLQDLSIDAVGLLFDVNVTNPYGVPLPLVNIDYGLTSEGLQFLSGTADLQSTVPARQSKMLSVPAKIVLSEALAVLQQFKPGSVVPYKADLGLSVDAPGVGRLQLPLSKTGKLPIPTVPDIQVQEIRWDELTLNSAKGVLRLHVINRNQFPMNLSKLSYALSLAGTKVASTGIEQAVKFDENGGANTFDIPISLSPASLGLAAFQMLTGKGGAGYSLEGVMDADTPYGAIPLPLKSIGNVLFKRQAMD